MAKAAEIGRFFESIIPSSLKMEGDNVGLLVDGNAEVRRALVALDITDEVIDEAVDFGAGLILSHHPLFFGLDRVSGGDPAGRKLLALISNGVAVLCLHTNLDCAPGGVNDRLLRALGAESGGVLEPQGAMPDGTAYGVGRFGELPGELSLARFLAHTKEALACGGLRYRDAGRPVRRIACCGGSGGEYLERAAALGCDTYVTADIKYNRFLDAAELGVNLIDADHFCTENVVVPYLAERLAEGFPDIEIQISRRHRQACSFF